MVKIDKNGILEFLSETMKIVVDCESKDEEKVKYLFCKYIDDDKDNFKSFFATLDNITHMLGNSIAE